jgi:RNA polymerase sigma-70 factor (ECF subfamily)
LIEKDWLASVDAAKGRFRSFLLASMKHFLANEWDKQNRLKRGGGRPVLSLDEQEADTRYREEPADHASPDKLYELAWARTVLAAALDALGGAYAARGKSNRFDALKPCLMRDPDAPGYAELGARLGLSEGAVKSAVHEMRGQFRERLLEVVGATVASRADAERELRDLLAAFSQ